MDIIWENQHEVKEMHVHCAVWNFGYLPNKLNLRLCNDWYAKKDEPIGMSNCRGFFKVKVTNFHFKCKRFVVETPKVNFKILNRRTLAWYHFCSTLMHTQKPTDYRFLLKVWRSQIPSFSVGLSGSLGHEATKIRSNFRRPNFRWPTFRRLYICCCFWKLTTLMSWMKANPKATSTFCVIFCTGLMSLL